MPNTDDLMGMEYRRLLRDYSPDIWNGWRKENPQVRPILAKMTFPKGWNYQDADFHDADMSGLEFILANLERSDFTDAYLFHTVFAESRLQNADFNRANMRQAVLSSSDFTGASLKECVLVNSRALAAKFCNADLSGARLQYADFRKTDLRGADFSGANLYETDFSEALLEGTVFNGAIITLTRFFDSEASAGFKSARMQEAIFENIDLRDAKDLETVIHERPSNIGISTYFRSAGQIPVTFLENAGVPNELINYLSQFIG